MIGYAATTDYNVSFKSHTGLYSGLTYHINTRYVNGTTRSERHVKQTTSIDGVMLHLPVGNKNDDYALQVVIRAYDIYGDFAQATVTTKV